MQEQQERKYEARDSKIVNRATGQAIPDDEPVFILRAQDKHAVGAILDYLERLGGDDHVDSDHRVAVSMRIDEFQQFRKANPKRMKHPDTSL